MFCTLCGQHVDRLKDGTLCVACDNARVKVAENKEEPLSFDQFYKVKSKQRTFAPVKKKKKESTSKTIHVSMLRECKGIRRQVSGSRVPIVVEENWNSIQVKRCAFEKLSRYCSEMIGLSCEDVKLVYKTGQVIRYIPGTNKPFTIKGYKEDLGARYSSIVLYLMPYDTGDLEDGSSDVDLPSVSSVLSSNHLSIPSIGEGSSTSSSNSTSNYSSSTISRNPHESSTISTDDSFGRSITCEKCSKTITEGEPCLSCIQDAEFAHSLMLDQDKEIDSADAEPVDTVVPLSPTSLRNRRLVALNANDSTGEVSLVKHATIHRMLLKNDMMALFSDEEIMTYDEINFKVVDIRGQPETGLGDGVTKDVLCSLFYELSLSHMIGGAAKVPSIRHDMSSQDWNSVGRMLVWARKMGYWPQYLSLPFVINCCFGEKAVDDKLLLDSFKQYISVDEKDTINSALEEFEPNNDTLLELLSAYKCYRLPTESNLKQILLEIAHQELIQKPRYVANCFTNTFMKLSKPIFKSKDDLINLYKNMVPSTRKVIKSMQPPFSMDDKEKSIIEYLQQYIKTLEYKELCKFLRYITGSDNLPEDGFSVIFVKQQTSRAPRSRVCICQLELEHTYLHYNELAEEMTNVLNNEDSFRFSIV